MQRLIRRKLEEVFADFQHQAEQEQGLCACKDLTYEDGRTPDYTDLLLQQHYMLRYFPAYLVEYFLMYQNLLNQAFLPNILKVLSIGCGCGVDLWGLNLAIRDHGADPAARINYTGIDLAPWAYQDDLGLPHVRFLNQDITDWDRLDATDYNVFVFPKCIGEFPTQVFNSICDMFQNTTFDRPRVCGLCSLMDMGHAADAARFTRIANIMQSTHAFRLLDEPNTYWHVPNPDRGLNTVCGDFDYPQEILDRVRVLLRECPTFQENREPCEDDCAAALNKWPILRAIYVNYKLLRFQRP
jgi:hypothetical protein